MSRRASHGFLLFSGVFSLLGTMVVASPTALAATSPVVRVTSSLDTVQPLDPVTGSTSATYRALRGQFQSFQMVIGPSSGSALSGVDVIPGALSGPGGSTIPLSDVTVYAEAYTRIWTPSDQEGLDEIPSLPANQRGWCRYFPAGQPNSPTCGIPVDTTDSSGVPFNTTWHCGGSVAPVIDSRECLIPDALIPRTDPFVGQNRNAFPFGVPAGENRVVWVDVLVPLDATAGTYAGSIAVSASGATTVSVPVSIQVLPVTLPPFGTTTQPNLDLQGGVLASIGSFCVTMGCSNGTFDDQFKAYSLFVRAALEDRLPLATVSTFSPDAGTRRTAFDHWIAPYLKGAAPTTLDGGILPSRLPSAHQRLVLLDGNATQAQWSSWVAALQAAGELNSLSFYCDEWMGSQSGFNTNCANPYATAAEPAWPGGAGHPPAFLIGTQAQFQTASGWGYDITANATRLVPNVMINLHYKQGSNTRPSYDPPNGFLATPGHEVWGYDSNNSLGGPPDLPCNPACADQLGWSIHNAYNGYPVLGGADQPATSERGIGFTSWAYRLDGHFYYDAMHRFAQAWNDCSVTPNSCLYDSFGGHGDGTLFYPGTPARIGGTVGIPIESMRLKRYRDGSQDYTMLRLLETGCGGDCSTYTRQQLAAIVGSPESYGAGGLMPTLWETSVGAQTYNAAENDLLDLFPQNAQPVPTGTITFVRSGSIWSMNADGTGSPQQLTNGTADAHPSANASGTRITFERSGDIWVMNADGTGQQNLTGSAGKTDSKPSFSSDGTKIAFVRHQGDDDIWVMDASGANPVDLTLGSTANEFDPAWSHDGTKIVFSSDRTGTGGVVGTGTDVFLMNANGSGATNLSQTSGDDDLPSFSPDDAQIAFDSIRSGTQYDVFVMNASQGAPQTNVTNTSGATSHEIDPVWSTDGSFLAFTKFVSGGTQIDRLAIANPTQQTNLSGSSLIDSSPDWYLPAAAFRLTVNVSPTSGGTVTSSPAGINCTSTGCVADFVSNQQVSLTATPANGSTFTGWSGACSGTGTCNLTMDAARSVTATFASSGGTTTLADNDPAIAYNGWVGVADAAANGGFYRQSSVKNDKATWHSPIATSITWVSRTGPDQGKASVVIDGVNKGTVDLYSASAASISKLYSGLSDATHTVVIKVLHTKNAASSGYGVRLDAFVVGATTTQESDPKIQYDAWKSTAQAKATDATYRSATAATATATVSFSGTAIDWLTTRGKAYGMATIVIDGTNKGTFDLYQTTSAWKVPISFSGLSSGPHTMVIQVLGQKNASATSTKVVVDGFVLHA